MLTDERAIGDTLRPLAVQMRRDGSPIDLTGKTVNFEMYDALGTAIVAPTPASISRPTLGYAEYTFQAADVANPGLFYAYFREVGSGGAEDTFPNLQDAIQVTIFDPAAVRSSATPPIDILGLASSPVRTRTVEGTVEERSVNELVKADQYLATKAAAANQPSWGIRLCLTRPSGTVGQSHRGVF